jgi:FkbM family methyltransferase
MTEDVRDRIVDEVRKTLDGESHGPNFADVFWSYRLFLLRNPEFEDSSSYAGRMPPDLRQLAKSFVDSPEFHAVWGDARQPLEDLVLLTENEGLRFWFNFRDRAIGHAIALGCYERDLTSFVRKTVKPGMNCLDVGANLGYFSVGMAKLTGSGGSVYSFEPFPANYNLLVRNVKENGVEGVVHPMQLAAYDRSGEGALFFRADPLNDNFGSMFVSERAQDGHLQSSAISRARIDEVVPRNLPIQFAKIDVEGAEIPALKGMAGIFERDHPTVAIEVNELALNRGNGSTPEELIGILKGFGYRLREIGSDEEFELPSRRDGYRFTNLVGIKPGKN